MKINKFKLRQFLIIIAIIMQGSLLSSFFISNNENWKIYLFIIICCLTLERFLEL